MLYQWTDNGLTQPIGDWDKNAALVQGGSAGAGALLVRRPVSERIRTEMKCGPSDILPPLGEDHSFFKKLKELGIPAYAAFARWLGA